MDEELRSKSRAPFRLISQEDFNIGSIYRIDTPELDQNVIYEARATSRQLNHDQSALAFDVNVEDVVSRHLSYATGFTAMKLLLLNEHYTPVEHYTILINDGYWQVIPSYAAINVFDSGAASPMARLKLGYIMPKPHENPDTVIAAIESLTELEEDVEDNPEPRRRHRATRHPRTQNDNLF